MGLTGGHTCKMTTVRLRQCDVRGASLLKIIIYDYTVYYQGQ